MIRFLIVLLMLLPTLAWGVSGKVTAGSARVRTSTRQIWLTITKDLGGEPCSATGLRCITGDVIPAGHRPNWWWVDAYVSLKCADTGCTGAETFTPGALWTLVGRSYGSQYQDSWKYHLVANEANDPEGEMNTIIHNWINGAPDPTFYLGTYSSDHNPLTTLVCTDDGVNGDGSFYKGGASAYIWHADISSTCGAGEAPYVKAVLVPGSAPTGCKPECEQVSEKAQDPTWTRVKELYR